MVIRWKNLREAEQTRCLPMGPNLWVERDIKFFRWTDTGSRIKSGNGSTSDTRRSLRATINLVTRIQASIKWRFLSGREMPTFLARTSHFGLVTRILVSTHRCIQFSCEQFCLLVIYNTNPMGYWISVSGCISFRMGFIVSSIIWLLPCCGCGNETWNWSSDHWNFPRSQPGTILCDLSSQLKSSQLLTIL